MDFTYAKNEVAGVAAHEIPAIGRELVRDLRDDSLRSVELDRLLAADEDAQHMIEADEMVDVRVRHEHLLEPVDLARRQCCDIAQIEQNGAPLEQRLDP